MNVLKFWVPHNKIQWSDIRILTNVFSFGHSISLSTYLCIFLFSIWYLNWWRIFCYANKLDFFFSSKEITYDNKMKNHQKPSCAGQKRIIQNDVDHFFFSLSLCVKIVSRVINLSKHLCVDVEFSNTLDNVCLSVNQTSFFSLSICLSIGFVLFILVDLVCRHSPGNSFSV